MIRDLDLTLKTMLAGEAEPGSELSTVEMSFSVPDEEWQKKGNKLELNVYLYDIRGNRVLRSNERRVQRNADGTVTRTKDPPRIDCSYMITAWNKVSSTGNEDKEWDEHRLLGQVLQVVLKNPTIPMEYLAGGLAGQEPPLPMVAAQKDELTDPVDFWGTLNSSVRPSIHCIVTISIDLKQSVTGPMVISKITDYRQRKKDGTVERIIQIGGRITDAANTTKGISGATVKIDQLKKATTTDSEGYFSILQIPPGNYHIRANADGYDEEVRLFTIPASDGSNYDISLRASS
jgi:hypothetical protein